MSTIRLQTIISATPETCFNLARSIDAHLSSLAHTNEKAIAGRTSGLIEEGETVTWEARHFGITQYLTVKISKMNTPHFFEDVMVKGAFKKMEHQHYFVQRTSHGEENNGGTLMKDVFTYETPFWIFGEMFDVLILKRYMTKLVTERNRLLKEMAEEMAAEAQ